MERTRIIRIDITLSGKKSSSTFFFKFNCFQMVEIFIPDLLTSQDSGNTN